RPRALPLDGRAARVQAGGLDPHRTALLLAQHAISRPSHVRQLRRPRGGRAARGARGRTMLPPLGVTRASGALVLSALLLACENGQPPRNAGGPSSGAPPACGDLGVSGERCEELLALALPETLPPSQGNAYADDDAAAELGFLCFYDPRFSGSPDVRCAPCNLPEKSFHDAKPVSEVVPGQPVARNSPTILTAAWMGPFFFWDGRADSLWSQ